MCCAVCCAKLFQSCLTLCDLMDCSLPSIPLSMGFSRNGYWSGLLCLLPGDCPNTGIKPTSLNVFCIYRQVLYY